MSSCCPLKLFVRVQGIAIRIDGNVETFTDSDVGI